MNMKKQIPLFVEVVKKEHGGSVDKAKRKGRRPLDVRKALHVTLKSSKAKGELSLLGSSRKDQIESLVRQKAGTYGIHLYHYANVGSHLHLCLKFSNRRMLQTFLRVVPGIIARLVTGARRGQRLLGRFWDDRVYTRIVEWGRDFRNVVNYVELNVLEGMGLVKRGPIVGSKYRLIDYPA